MPFGHISFKKQTLKVCSYESFLGYYDIPTLTSTDLTIEIETLWEWLSPQDKTHKQLQSDKTDKGSVRQEDTCEWYEQHLLSFSQSDDSLFLVTGKDGCGKTVLSEWIVERLQRTLGRKSYDVLSLELGKNSAAPTFVKLLERLPSLKSFPGLRARILASSLLPSRYRTTVGIEINASCRCRPEGRNKFIECRQAAIASTT